MGKLVLVIDDDYKSVKLVRYTLEAQGYSMLEAYNCKRGIQIAKDRQPNLIIIGNNNPVVSGMTTTQLLKSEPMTRKIPIIITTSPAIKGDEEKILETGASSYLTKPIDIHKLISLTKKYIQ